MDLINQGHSGYQLCQKNTVIIMGDNFTYYSFYRSIRQRRWQKSICCAIACLAISGKPDSMARQRGHPDGKEELPHTTSNFLPDYLYSTGHQTKLTYPSIFSLYNATVRNDLKNPSHSGQLYIWMLLLSCDAAPRSVLMPLCTVYLCQAPWLHMPYGPWDSCRPGPEQCRGLRRRRSCLGPVPPVSGPAPAA